MDCSTPGFAVHHQLPELAQTHVHRVGDAIQPSHPLSLPSLPTFNLSQHQGLFQWVSSSHQFSSVTQSCPTLCDPKDCSMPGLPVPHHLPEFAQVHVHCIGDAISSSAALFSFCCQSFPASGAFPVSQAHHALCSFKQIVPIVCWGGNSYPILQTQKLIPLRARLCVVC